MSRRCNGCDGIVGIDCFNPSECEWISHDMEMRRQRDTDAELEHLRTRVAELERSAEAHDAARSGS